MKVVFQRIAANRFVTDLLKVASGTAFAQAVSLLSMLLISRLYSPDDLGLQSVIMSIVGVLGPLATLCFPMAIVVARTSSEAAIVFRLSSVLSYVMAGVVVGVLLIFLVSPESSVLRSLSPFCWLIPVFVVLSGLMSVYTHWLMRAGSYGSIASASVWQSLLAAGSKVVGGFFFAGPAFLVLGSLLGNAIQALLLWRSCSPRLPSSVSKEEMCSVLVRYRDFAILRTPQAVISMLSMGMPVFFLTSHFGESAAGYYALAYTILAAPIHLVGNSLVQVFFPQLARTFRDRSVSGDIARLTLKLLCIGLLPLLAILAFAPDIFAFFFGDVWEFSGVLAQWMSIWLFLGLLNRPAVAAIPVLGLEKGLLVYEVLSTSLKLFALWVGCVYFQNELSAVAMLSVAGGVSYVGLICWVFLLARRCDARAFAGR